MFVSFLSHALPSERLAEANRLIAQQPCETRKVHKPFRVDYQVHHGEYVK